MGFASPASDYVEKRLSADSLCGTGPNTRIIETDSGYAVIDVSLKPQQQSTVLIAYDGLTDFAKVMGRAFITRDGEAIEGDGVEVFGVVTFSVNDLRRDDSPV